MAKQTTVVNMKKPDEKVVYSLPPVAAVVAAYRQFTLNDWNWWKSPRNPVPLEEGRWHWFCGDFAVRKEGV